MTQTPSGALVRIVAERAELHDLVAGAVRQAQATVSDRAGAGLDLLVIDHCSAGSLGPSWSADGRQVVVACLAGESVEALAAASRLGAPHVVELPRAQDWLSALLRVVARRGKVHAVIGSPGGAGATTLAVALALASAQHQDTLLVDADCWSPGVDTLLFAEPPATTWLDIDSTSTSLDLDSVRQALPVVSGIWVLSGHDGLPEAVSARLPAVVDAGRRGFARTVLDPGSGPLASSAIGLCDHAFLVVQASVPGVQLARRLLRGPLAGLAVTLVVRRMRHLASDEVGNHLGLPVAARIPTWRGLPEAGDSGELLAGRSGRRLMDLGAAVWGAAP